MTDVQVPTFEATIKKHGSATALYATFACAALLLSFVPSIPILASLSLTTIFGGIAILAHQKFAQAKILRDKYRVFSKSLAEMMTWKDPARIEEELKRLGKCLLPDTHQTLFDRRRPDIEARLEKAKIEWEERKRLEAYEGRKNDLKAILQNMRASGLEGIDRARANHPLLAKKAATEKHLLYVRAWRQQLEVDLDEAMAKTSWWNQLVNAPDLSPIDEKIRKFEDDIEQFRLLNASEIGKAKKRFKEAKARFEERLDTIEADIFRAIPTAREVPFDGKNAAHNALFLGALSVPVSVWHDVSNAGNVFDTLRSVNGNFADLNDFEAWLHCLTMSPESLAGLVSLTKGAMFEQHVAKATGGELHEHFNVADTDMIIDGTAFQIKATDSETYIESVDPDIPVIVTSEVADLTGAIDGGLTEAELDHADELALGGAVVDIPDTISDAAFATIGGIGILGALRGIHHAIDAQRQGLDKGEAIEEGIWIAATSGMKATVDIAELGFKTGSKILMSRPSRFLGRQTMKLIEKLDTPEVEDLPDRAHKNSDSGKR